MPATHDLARRYIDGVRAAEQFGISAEPEAQLTAPIKELFEAIITDKTQPLVLIREAQLNGVRPDFAALLNGRPCGWVELKAPGRPVDGSKWHGREARQWDLLAELDALIVCNGEQAQLYRSGVAAGAPVDLPSDPTSAWNAEPLRALLRLFATSKPSMIKRVSELSIKLAPMTRLLKDRILDLLSVPGNTAMRRGLKAWEAHVHNGVNEPGFANDLAQVVAYSLAIAALRGGVDYNNDGFISLTEARTKLGDSSPVLAAALGPVLGVKGLLDSIKHEVAAIERLASVVDPSAVANSKDPRGEPWLWFYEDFLKAYDPKTRQKAGVYYTPTAIVQAQVHLIEDLLVNRFDRDLGFADQGVVTLDPACGSGTYPLAVIDAAVTRATLQRGAAGPAQISATLAHNLIAFELMPGPYAVAHLRIGQRMAETSGDLIPPEIRVYLTDTLDDPSSVPAMLDLWGDVDVLAEERRRAQAVKREEPVMVVLGNPPYGRVSQSSGAGGWIVASGTGRSLFDDILEPVNTIFSHTTSLYNLYVYFWRWSLWKVLESEPEGPAIVSFITASSWLDGPGFVGLRQLAQSLSDEIWVCDLGGDNRGGAVEENVFDIQIPVAIVTLVRDEQTHPSHPAKVYYRRVLGTRAEKLATMDRLTAPDKSEGDWELLPVNKLGDAMTLVSSDSRWTSMPALTDLFPWQMAGMYANRTWPISPSPDVLAERWRALVSEPLAEKRSAAFATAPTGRNIHTRVRKMQPLSSLPTDAPSRPIVRYSFRSFDRQWTFDDPRLINLERPSLWASLSDRQIFMTTTTGAAVGAGPALTLATYVPDRHHFMGSNGGKDAIPLYRDMACAYPNVTRGLLTAVGVRLRSIDERVPNPTVEDLAAYVYGLLSSSAYFERFAENLKEPGLRVPITADPELFNEACKHGRIMIWLHSFGARCNSPSRGGKIPRHTDISWTQPVVNIPASSREISYNPDSQELYIGQGIVSGVRREVWEFSVTSWKVVQKWLAFRTGVGSGRAASRPKPLDLIRPTKWEDAWNIELLELLTVLTRTVEAEQHAEELLARICVGPFIEATSLPYPTPIERKEPKV